MKLPPGKYHAKCLYHSFTVNSAGNPEIRLTVLPCQTPPGEPPLPTAYTPAPIITFMTITPATIGTADDPGWVLLTLQHLGFTSADLTLLDPDHEMAHSFTGIDVLILGTEDEYKGKKRTRWNILRSSTEASPIGQAALLALSIRYADALKCLRPNPGTNHKEPF